MYASYKVNKNASSRAPGSVAGTHTLWPTCVFVLRKHPKSINHEAKTNHWFPASRNIPISPLTHNPHDQLN